MLVKCIYLIIFYNIKQQYCKILLTVFYFNIMLDLLYFYSCDAKLNFQHNYPNLKCHVILQKSL